MKDTLVSRDPCSREGIASYIAEVLSEMAGIAGRERFTLLRYLLDMAAAEAVNEQIALTRNDAAKPVTPEPALRRPSLLNRPRFH